MRELKGKFKGWVVDEDKGLIYDSDNNEFDLNEIRAIFIFRQWQKGFFGTQGDISSLKEKLIEKIEKYPSPQVTIDWGDIKEKYIHPNYRK